MARKNSNPLIDDQIMDQAFSELAALVEESEALLDGRGISAGGRRDCHRLRRLLRRGSELAGQLSRRTAPALEGTRQYVAAHPLKALGLAAAAGLLAALLVNRRE
ncbi:glycine zipper domain-containing protein [Pseudomonas sp. DC3200b2]|uniref:glycine zipper domain-containing protein n=1 Tax=Pseudomonas sp. DC3200b2 TaxID=2804669 RepID=UPI003CE6DD9F